MKLLIVLPRIPYPLEKGDKLRAFHQIKALSEKHTIVLLATGKRSDINHASYDHLQPYCSEIHYFVRGFFSQLWHTAVFFLRGRPLQCGYFYSSRARKLIQRYRQEGRAEHIYCQLFRTAEMVRGIQGPKTIDYQDAFSASMKKRMKAASGLKKWLLWLEYKRIRKYEVRIYSWFDTHTIISETDKQYLQMQGLEIVRNGVDTDYFRPPAAQVPDNDLIFTGNMSYLPNVHTAIYLVREVMPLIWKEKPGAKLVLAGSSPDRRVIRLAGDKVTVTGWIDDIRTAYQNARVFIAPMHTGTGLQNKILEAMAMELPCVTSESARAPIDAEHGKELMVANSADQYAQMTIKLLNDENTRKEMGKTARTFVIQRFNWNACTEKLNEMISENTR
ncbi:MAG: glycosyltransferase [Bacteroidales bacterium]